MSSFFGAIVTASSSSSPSVTRWVCALKEGDQVAATRLWEYANRRLLAVAKRQVGGFNPRGYDEDDVASSAFAAFCHAINDGAYPNLDSRTELWQLLIVITLNKARTKARDEGRLRRGGGVRHVPLSDDLLNIADSFENDPALAALANDECARRLSKLDREEVRLVALLRVEGYNNQEIANQLGCTRRSVHRRLELIRQAWQDDCPSA